MSDFNSIKEMFQSLVPPQVGIFSARVTKRSPLQVISTNNDKLQISSSSLIVPKHLTKHIEKMSFTINDGEKNINCPNIEVTVDNSLNIGDIVYILQISNVSKFLIIGRRD